MRSHFRLKSDGIVIAVIRVIGATMFVGDDAFR